MWYHKYLVLASGVYITIVNFGSAFGLAVLFEEIRIQFNASRAETALVLSLFYGLLLCLGFVVGIAIHRFGPMAGALVGTTLHSVGFIVSYFVTSILFLQISFGVICGVGGAFVFLSSSVVMTTFFEGKTRVFALAAVSSGQGIGGIFFPYVFSLLFQKYGLHGAFLILGGISLNSIPLTFLWRPAKNPKENEASTKPLATTERSNAGISSILRQLCRNNPYLLYSTGTVAVLTSSVSCATIMVDIWLSKGLPADNTVLLTMIFWLVGLLGRQAVGILKQIPRYSVLLSPLWAGLVSAISVFALIFTNSLAGNVVIAASLGIGHCATSASMFVVLSRLVEAKQLSIASGILVGFTGLLSTVASPIHGHLRDVTQSYTASLAITFSCILLGSILFLAAIVVRTREAKRRMQDLQNISE